MICAARFSERSRRVARSGINPMNQNSREIVAYVETAKTSHTSGLRNCVHTLIVLGYGNSQYASQGRPRWSTGNIPAQATANSVMASANRLMEFRQDCRNKRRIAEISVPAWQIPIQQTKLTMANPQPTGLFTPHIPTPRTNK